MFDIIRGHGSYPTEMSGTSHKTVSPSTICLNKAKATNPPGIDDTMRIRVLVKISLLRT